MKRVIILAVVLCVPVAAFSQISILDTLLFNQYSEPYGVEVNAVTNIIYVALSNEGILAAIDGVTHTTIANIPVGGSPLAVGINPYRNKIYVVNNFDDNVHVIDAATHTVIDTIDVGWAPIAIAVDSLFDYAYVLNDLDITVSVIDVISDSVVAVIPLILYDYANDIAVDQSTHNIFVTHGAAGYVTAIDGITHSVIDTFDVGGPYISGIDCNSINHSIYVANQARDTVLLIDGSSHIVLDGEQVGLWPFGICVNPTTHRIFVANTGSDDMSVIDGTTHNLIGTFPAGAEPLRLAVDPVMSRVYLSCRLMDAVIVYGDDAGVEEKEKWDEGDEKWKLAATPNPFSSEVRIQISEVRSDLGGLSSEHCVKIYDTAGRLVQTLSFPPACSVVPTVVKWDAKGIAPGIYFLSMDGEIKQKIVKLE